MAKGVKSKKNTKRISPLRKTIQAIKRHKLIFLMIIITQILFSSLLLYSHYKIQIPILTDGKDIIVGVQENMQTQSNPAGDYNVMRDSITSIVGIQSLVDRLIKNLIYLCGISFALWIILNGLNWFFTINMHKKKKLHNFCLRFTLTSIIYLVPMTLALWWFMSSSVKTYLFGTARTAPAIGSAVIILIFAYFFYITLSLLHKDSFKEIIKLTFKIGIKKIGRVLATYIPIIILYIALFLTMYHSLEANIYLIYLEIIAFLFLIILSRSYIYFSINNIEKEIK
ncbi:hypothetical protein HN419_07550 [Candidatus Woesearchaeota archaeon]|jgi:hypothetical protein|nr:hypothetical protein [Candidatus Woesearchaeota archaeon]MBT3538349.1 hypothetical protein [Candidatus Woesearchaeota archaeon]MBT4698326.1 hypothetical protein [Candidatus Woesearchaeota archaeon]MBT4716775.1 hypothetical protein [Candidatus Woesearchaeota archaeon]MBT7106018.1 hypothetical protein [Candidatus Woesearchaeota archaeon]